MKNFSKLLFILLVIFTACEKKTEEKTTTAESPAKKIESTDVVKKEIDLINDSLNTAWKNMIASDDQKLADIKRLLLEISYTSDYDVVLHDSLVKELAALKSKRYDESLDSSQIDNYDIQQDQLIHKVMYLKAQSKEIKKHPLADELVKDINKANSVEILVPLRMNYDAWAKAYNKYIAEHKTELQKLGEPYSSMKPRGEIIK